MSKGGVAGRRETPAAGPSAQTAVSVVCNTPNHRPRVTEARLRIAPQLSENVEVWRVRSSRPEAMINDR